MVYSDHKPLLSEAGPVPVMASARRWVLTLSTYNYSIESKAGRAQGNADVLSNGGRTQRRGWMCMMG